MTFAYGAPVSRRGSPSSQPKTATAPPTVTAPHCTESWLVEMSDLRTRIAKALYRNTHDSDKAWDGLHPMITGSYLSDADAVIAELDLQPIQRTTMFPERRWVTPWELIDPVRKADDE